MYLLGWSSLIVIVWGIVPAGLEAIENEESYHVLFSKSVDGKG
jgi:hypothetical protein